MYDQELWIDFERILDRDQCLVLEWYCGGLSENRIYELSTYSRRFIRNSVKSAAELMILCFSPCKNVNFDTIKSSGQKKTGNCADF